MMREIIQNAVTGEIVEREIPAPAVEEILQAERSRMVCSRFQAKAALIQAGLLPQIEGLMARAEPLAKLAWSDATQFRRDSPTIAAMASAAGLSDTQIDDLFRAAMSITA